MAVLVLCLRAIISIALIFIIRFRHDVPTGLASRLHICVIITSLVNNHVLSRFLFLLSTCSLCCILLMLHPIRDFEGLNLSTFLLGVVDVVLVFLASTSEEGLDKNVGQPFLRIEF